MTQIRVTEAGEDHLEAITRIYNHAIEHTTSVWTEEPVGVANRRAWLAEHNAGGYPVIVALDGNEVVGFASLSAFRPWPGYFACVENSIYVAPECAGKGIGTLLLSSLVERAEPYHTIVAGIEATNDASIRIHQKLGFTKVGELPQVGSKFGRWLDLTFMEKIVDSQRA
ncbi:GNAT family N-acetyltransferase [Winkia neuii]|uniref:N-acetyltransferase domain-containing protein n=1 Tax=Winkia neuii BV029A5 TaxID=888439 RepID=K0YVH7_9ACTO|nr:GNAT family N-acetyltransferase [Winkia neuii]EJZ87937.1 hypothetical protein HMPREF9240_00196 [Winkia neuii BV029A5]